MKVTKLIREYVEREIKARFQHLLDALGKEYNKEKDMGTSYEIGVL